VVRGQGTGRAPWCHDPRDREFGAGAQVDQDRLGAGAGGDRAGQPGELVVDHVQLGCGWQFQVGAPGVGCDGDGRSCGGEVRGGDSKFCAGGAGVQPLVPDGDDEVGVGEGQGAG
jgi:hypothetical protein